MKAELACENGHRWTVRFVPADPETNVCEFPDGDDICPECGSETGLIQDIEDDGDDEFPWDYDR